MSGTAGESGTDSVSARRLHRSSDSGAGPGGLLDNRRLMGFAFLAPAVVYIVLLIGVPFVTAFAYSLSDATVGNTSFRYAGLCNFRTVLYAPDFHAALRNTVVFALVAQVFVLILANMLALSVIGWLWMFDSKYSPIDYLLEQIGLLGPGTVWGPSRNLTWLGKIYLAKASIIFVHVWRMTPLATVILMAGLSSIPTDLSDQAKADGARYFRALFQVKLPMYSFLVGIDGGTLSQGAAIALFIFPVLLAVAIMLLRTASRAQVR